MGEVSCVAFFQGTRHRTTRKRKPDQMDTGLTNIIKDLESDQLGPFWFHKSTSIVIENSVIHVGLQKRERLELNELLRINFITEDFLKNILVPLNDESSSVPRLRMYNWAVTNYAKEKAITIQINDKDGKIRLIDPAISYDSALKRLHRTLFDPYRRASLLFFRLEKDVHHTTVGQLLFVKWCIENCVDKFVETHEDDIREHLNESNRQRKIRGNGRVKELTSSKLKHARIATTSAMDATESFSSTNKK